MLWIWRGAKPRTLSEDFKDCAHFNMSVFEPLSGYPGHLGNLITFYKIFPRKREWWCQPNVRVCMLCVLCMCVVLCDVLCYVYCVCIVCVLCELCVLCILCVMWVLCVLCLCVTCIVCVCVCEY